MHLPRPIDRAAQLARAKVLHPLAHRSATVAVAFGRQVLRYAYIGAADGERLGFAAFGERSMLQQPYAVLMGADGIAVGDDTLISPEAILAAAPEWDWTPADGPLVSIGSHVWAARGLSVVAHRRVEIGDDVWFGPEVYITDASHDMELHAEDPHRPIGQRMEPARPVRIGNGSWIGTGAVICPGVTIGEQVAVGANSVVAHDLPDRCVAVGAPARVVRELSPG